MKKLTLCIFFLMLLVPAVALGAPQSDTPDTVVAAPTIDENSIAGSKDPDIFTRKAPQTAPIIDGNSIAGSKEPDLVPLARGCCSWHKGVCGCENGRAVCCDGTYSPTCGC